MARNYARRASDGRRWQQHDRRVVQTTNLRNWFAGTAALDIVEDEPPKPKCIIIPSLCDGLIYVIGRSGIYYEVMIGAQRKKVAPLELMRRWALFYAQFETAVGVTAAKHTTPTKNLLPAPQQPIALLPSGLANAR